MLFQMQDTANQLKSFGKMRQFSSDGMMKKMVSCEGITYQFNTSSAHNYLTSTLVSLKFNIPLITGRLELNKIFASTRRDALHVKYFHDYVEKKRNRTWRFKDTDTTDGENDEQEKGGKERDKYRKDR